MNDENTTSVTTAKTLWSETVLEILYEFLQKEKSDAKVREVLNEVRKKGFKRDYLLKKIEKKLDKQAADRVRRILDE